MAVREKKALPSRSGLGRDVGCGVCESLLTSQEGQHLLQAFLSCYCNLIFSFRGQYMLVFCSVFTEIGNISPGVSAELFHAGYQMHSSQ